MGEDLKDKVMSAKEAVQKYIKPGTHIAFGGFTLLRRPNTIARDCPTGNWRFVCNYERWYVCRRNAGGGRTD